MENPSISSAHGTADSSKSSAAAIFKNKKALKCTASLVLIISCFFVLLFFDAEDYQYYQAGGWVGLFSASIVIVDSFWHNEPGVPFTLLFWRAVSDAGLAIRFLLNPVNHYYSCGHWNCSRENADPGVCGLSSFVLEFFLLAAAGWYLCDGIDLYYSITNPFSSFKSRVPIYHGFVWSFAGLISVTPFFTQNWEQLYGFWFVNPRADDTAMCWINVEENPYLVWVYFFIPLVVISIVCTFCLFVAYMRLRRGITRSFLPRMRLLIVNMANVMIITFYWTILIVFYTWTFFSNNDNEEDGELSNNMLSFVLASKGFSSLLVLIVTSMDSSSTVWATLVGNDIPVDVNVALREEVLAFATAGIRASARAARKAAPDRKKIVRRPVNMAISVVIGAARNGGASPGGAGGAPGTGRPQVMGVRFFFRFMLGMSKEVRLVQEVIGSKRRTVDDQFQQHTIASSTNSSEVAGLGDDRVSTASEAAMRHSTASACGSAAGDRLSGTSAGAGADAGQWFFRRSSLRGSEASTGGSPSDLVRLSQRPTVAISAGSAAGARRKPLHYPRFRERSSEGGAAASAAVAAAAAASAGLVSGAQPSGSSGGSGGGQATLANENEVSNLVNWEDVEEDEDADDGGYLHSSSIGGTVSAPINDNRDGSGAAFPTSAAVLASGAVSVTHHTIPVGGADSLGLSVGVVPREVSQGQMSHPRSSATATVSSSSLSPNISMHESGNDAGSGSAVEGARAGSFFDRDRASCISERGQSEASHTSDTLVDVGDEEFGRSRTVSKESHQQRLEQAQWGKAGKQEKQEQSWSQWLHRSLGFLNPWNSFCDWFANIFTFLDPSDIVEFTEFSPYQFRRIRASAALSDVTYCNYFSTTIKERLTQGGSSGSFFFYSKDERFIAKSCTEQELETLHEYAEPYADYLLANKTSCISRIFGAYKLHMYGISMHFFVMNNILQNPEHVLMNEKYDIKGSWVKRHATPPQDGMQVTCMHCEQKYTYRKKRRVFGRIDSIASAAAANFSARTLTISGDNGAVEMMGPEVTSPIRASDSSFNQSLSHSHSHSHNLSRSYRGARGHRTEVSQRLPPHSVLSSIFRPNSSFSLSSSGQQRNASMQEAMGLLSDYCPYTVSGLHEPNLTLKDNDIKYKIRLPPPTAVKLLQQLRRDAEFLCMLGVMDYSLLVGVHNTEYEVRGERAPIPAAAPVVGTAATTGGVSGTRAASAGTPYLVRAASTSTSSSGGGGGGASSLGSFDRHWEKSTSSDKAAATAVEADATGGFNRKLEAHRVVGPDGYYLGIIDFQQKWDLSKIFERWGKIYFQGADPDGLSAIEPEIYKERFLKKVEDLLDLETLNRTYI